MRRILWMSLVLPLLLGCLAPLLAADTPPAAKAPLPAFLLAPAPVSPDVAVKGAQGTAPTVQPQPMPKWMDAYADCEAACFDGWNQCCTYGGCEQCSCQLALCRAGCGDPYYGC